MSNAGRLGECVDASACWKPAPTQWDGGTCSLTDRYACGTLIGKSYDTDGMCLELWDAVSRNITSDFETEAEALAYVRVLVQQGWKAAELLLIFDDPALAVEDLPAAVSGDELARRAEDAVAPKRRTA